MSKKADTKKQIETFIEEQNEKSLLRFITCGSVDDGKSTLIGRLLYESKLLFEDQIENLKNVSKKMGTQGDDIDFALLVDGLASEREQGITIDVAYRFFNTERRKFIVIDTPGHEQYTRNMATGASQAQLAVLMVDARAGLTQQTRRHAYIVHLLGIKQIVLAINKMDLVDYDQEKYNAIVAEFEAFAGIIGISEFTSIPMSALKGANVIEAHKSLAWFKGPTLIEHLQTVPVDDDIVSLPFAMPVQWVNRPNLDFRGFAGRVVSGTMKPGDNVIALPSNTVSKISTIHTMDGDLPEVRAGQSVTLCLEDEIDVSRGDIICQPGDDQPQTTDGLIAKLLWMTDEKLHPGRTYRLKIGTQSVNASVTQTRYVIDINTLHNINADTLDLNEIGECIIQTEKPVLFKPYRESRDLGGFILIDKMTNATVAMGLIESESLEKETQTREPHWNPSRRVTLAQNQVLDRETRSAQKQQKPMTIWFSGFKLSGKTFIADALDRMLFERGHHSFILEPRNVFPGLSEDLGFSESDQLENIRRIAHTSKLINDNGIIAITCFISPLSFERRLAKRIIGPESFMEVYLDTPIEIAMAQDTEGYYAKARRGDIKNVPGVDALYEVPKSPDLTLSLRTHSPDEAAEVILSELVRLGIIPGK
jgi:bifunctional enzyme CysN/CysC